MASLTLTVGAITSEKTATNVTVNALISDYIAAYDGPASGTAQQKADWFMDHLVRHIREAANGQNIRKARDMAEEQANETIKTRDWI